MERAKCRNGTQARNGGAMGRRGCLVNSVDRRSESYALLKTTA